MSSVRKSRTSRTYSPTTCSISRFSIGGKVYGLSVVGVRKQPTMTPLSGRGRVGAGHAEDDRGLAGAGRVVHKGAAP